MYITSSCVKLLEQTFILNCFITFSFPQIKCCHCFVFVVHLNSSRSTFILINFWIRWVTGIYSLSVLFFYLPLFTSNWFNLTFWQKKLIYLEELSFPWALFKLICIIKMSTNNLHNNSCDTCTSMKLFTFLFYMFV